MDGTTSPCVNVFHVRMRCNRDTDLCTATHTDCSHWRAQNFRMGRVEVPEAPRGSGEGMPHPTGEGSGEGAVPPALPRIFFVFFFLKIQYFDAF